MRWSRVAGIAFGAGLVAAAVPIGAFAGLAPAPGGEIAVTAPAPPQPPGPVPPVPVLESQLLGMINAERAAAGAGALQPQAWAHGVAEDHAQEMAAAGDIGHNLSGFIDQGHAAMGAVYLGENVAMDSTLAADDALLYSDPPHRTILLDPRFNFVGVGVALDDKNWVYVTEDFAEIPGGARPAPVHAAAPASAPPPVVKPPAAVIKPTAPSLAPAAPTIPPSVVAAAAAAAAPTPTAPPAPSPAPVAAKAQEIAARPVSQTSPLRGSAAVLALLSGVLLSTASVRRLVADVGPSARASGRPPTTLTGAVLAALAQRRSNDHSLQWAPWASTSAGSARARPGLRIWSPTSNQGTSPGQPRHRSPRSRTS